MSQTAIKPEVIAAMRDARATGVSMSELVAEYGFSWRCINQHTRKAKLERVTCSDRIITALQTFGSLTPTELGEEIGQARSWINVHLLYLEEATVVERFNVRDAGLTRPRVCYRLTREYLAGES